MFGHLKILALLAAIGLTIGVIASLRPGTISAQEQEQAGKSHYPVADFEAPAPVDSKARAIKQARGSRYSRGSKQKIKELPLDVEELPLIPHGWSDVPALPATESDAVLIGEVADAQAFLSNDKTAVYSEFTIRVDESLKSNNSSVVGEMIVAERSGGAVRFPSGRVQYYSVHQRGLPRIGARYIFFLKHNEVGDDFSIVTAYELKAGRICPLDGTDTDKGAKLPYDKYKGYDEASFLKLIRATLSEPSPTQGGRGGLRQ